MRYNKLTDELIEKLAAEIEEGLPIKYGCNLCSIYVGTFFLWMQTGERDFAEGIESQESKLFEAVKKAKARFIKNAMRDIKKGVNGWQGMAWWLERTDMDFQKSEGTNNAEENIVVHTSLKKNQN